VAVTSEPGVGSCFSVWLPWRDGESSSDSALDTPLTEAFARPLALVVEDDVKAAGLMRIQLEAAGFRVRRAASAEAALALVPECTPDLITLDILLPGMDGWDFLARIKELPTWTDIPVVVVSVAADHEVGLSLGAAAVMQKPIGRNDFAHELQKLGFEPAPDREVKVLVVDDDPNTVDLMSAYLCQPGYSVLRAFGGQEGIELTQRHLPDVVVLDLLMPDVGGIEVVEALKRDAATAQIPVIVVASRQFSVDDREQLNRHALSVIDKGGLGRERFLGEVRRAFSRPARAGAG
jgi:CheY-like chemotaxis protein